MHGVKWIIAQNNNGKYTTREKTTQMDETKIKRQGKGRCKGNKDRGGLEGNITRQGKLETNLLDSTV